MFGAATLRQPVRLVPAMMAHGQGRRDLRPGARPEGKFGARDTPVDLGRRREAVVAVRLVVPDKTGDLVPERPPRWSSQPEPRREPGRIGEREVEPGEGRAPGGKVAFH